MKSAIIQFKIDPQESIDQTMKRMSQKLDECRDADLIVLPEMWAVGYYSFDEYAAHAETENGPVISFLKRKAKELHAYIAGGSIVERDGGRLYNTLFFLSPDGHVAAKYRKQYMVGFDSREAELLTAGDSTTTIRTEFGVIGFAICYDLRFPELFRTMVDDGVDYIIVTAAWAFPRIEHWLTLCKARAIENVCYVLACNSSGAEHGKTYFGHSMILDPWGTILASGGCEEAVIRAETDKHTVSQIRAVFPPVQDRWNKLADKHCITA